MNKIENDIIKCLGDKSEINHTIYTYHIEILHNIFNDYDKDEVWESIKNLNEKEYIKADMVSIEILRKGLIYYLEEIKNKKRIGFIKD